MYIFFFNVAYEFIKLYELMVIKHINIIIPYINYIIQFDIIINQSKNQKV